MLCSWCICSVSSWLHVKGVDCVHLSVKAVEAMLDVMAGSRVELLAVTILNVLACSPHRRVALGF